MRFFLFIAGCLFIFGCTSKKKNLSSTIRVNTSWLDSIRQSSDTSYVKKYSTGKFVNATYYVNNKQAIICQVMKDSADTIRQIIIAKNNKRNFVAEYYANGQLMAKLPLDTFGQYHGPSKYYYQNGRIESEGDYDHGLKKGGWENYTKEGKPAGKNEYDNNGNVIMQTAH